MLAAEQPPAPVWLARSFEDARAIADDIGYPVLVRPSYVLGGRGMEIVYDESTSFVLHRPGHRGLASPPVLVDRFLDDAVEIDVDALYDGSELYLGGVMEHIEEAGIHSGDSPAHFRRSRWAPRWWTGSAAPPRRSPGGRRPGLDQHPVRAGGDTLYVLEANPRASRTVPFVSKATATPLAKAAARVMLGATIAELRGEGSASRR